MEKTIRNGVNGGMRYAVLGSGSDANAYIFEHKGRSFIIDNGFSLRELRKRTAIAGFSLETLDFIFLTHTHGDHMRGVSSLAKFSKAAVVAHQDLWLEAALPRGILKTIGVVPGKNYQYGAISFEAFSTVHDSPHSLGYTFTFGPSEKVTIITDTGTITEEMYLHASKANILFIEANYDRGMLEKGAYPLFLKNRITSAYGHLSNDDALGFLKTIKSENNLQRVYLCHLSGNNNDPDLLNQMIIDEISWSSKCRVLRKGELYWE